MSKDYTVAKELASLKEIKQSAEQRISELSLNALNYVNDHRLHKASSGSESGGEDIDDYYDVIVEWEEDDEGESYPVITKFPTSDPGHDLRFVVKTTNTDTDETYYYPLYFKELDEDHNPLYSTLSWMNSGITVNDDVYKFIEDPSGGISVEFVGTDTYEVVSPEPPEPKD